MTLADVLLLTFVAVVTHLLLRTRQIGQYRGWVLLVLSVFILFWLQPAMPLRWMDFWLPVLTIFLVSGTWFLTADPAQKRDRTTLITLGIVVLIILFLALTRYTGWDAVLTAAKPPPIQQILAGLLFLAIPLALLAWRGKNTPAWQTAGILILLALFILLKLPALTGWLSSVLRAWLGQSTAAASALDIRWLGYSYVAFRLIHTLRDRQAGRLEAYSLRDTLNYVIFFPAISAGPIDRIQRFQKDLSQPVNVEQSFILLSFQRLVVGMFKKFVIADTLALFALNSQNASQLQPGGWVWLPVYAYTFQIFFDFSGYTDIAIGLGRLLGINLPENFNKPYRKPNLTQFWNNWHITLTQWFRAYFFNPVTRALRTRWRRISPAWLILITQVSTMVLIGLWHGITWNFVIWGAWHGLGLFIQNRYSEWVKPRIAGWEQKPLLRVGLPILNVLLTFHFVALGWIWFALPQLTSSLRVFAALAGISLD